MKPTALPPLPFPAAAVAVALALLLASCSPDAASLTNAGAGLPIGENVVVQFDRSALGAAASLPVQPTTESVNGAETALRGKLVFASAEWVKVEASSPQATGTSVKTFWIPRAKILLIQTDHFHGN